jgi:hypothetical protein
MAEKKNDRSIWISVTLSVLALAVSIFSLYFQFLRSVHEIRATVAHFDLADWANGNTTATAKGVILNAGNQSEIIFEVKPLMGDLQEGGGSYTIFPHTKGPFVLKPGEAVPYELSSTPLRENFEEQGNWDAKNETSELDVAVDFVAVSPQGPSKDILYRVGALTYNDPSDNFSFKPDIGFGNQWTELLK